MAYYPLKVKDNSGNTHVVGDPRIADKADKASPALTGTPTAPTAAAGTNTTQIATTAFVQTAVGSGSVADGSITSAKIADGTIVDADVSASAAIAQSKISNLTTDLANKANSSHTHTSDQVSVVTRSVQTGSYTLVLTDAGDLVEMGSASAQTLTIPTNASVAFPVGTKIDVLQTGAGECSIAPDTGVTLNSDSNKRKINVQWAAATLVKRGTDTWVLIGALKA